MTATRGHGLGGTQATVDVSAVTWRRREIHTGWTARCVGPDAEAPAAVDGLGVPVTVPGQLHPDLLRAGLISEPTLGEGEREQMWVGRSRWEYRTEFTWAGVEADGQVELVAEGIDTIATVALNGEVLGHTRDQHLTYRWPVADRLRVGTNTLTVVFESAFAAADEAEQRFGVLPRPYPEPYPYLRKAACNFGWDWGPRLVTVGIWRPLYLETWAGARLEAVRPTPDVRVAGDSAEGRVPEVAVHVAVDLVLAEGAAPQVEARVELLDPAAVVVAEARLATGGSEPGALVAAGRLGVPNPQLWWPVGMGAQPLYLLRTTVLVDGVAAQVDEREVGLRSVRIDEGDAPSGSRFTLVVNDRPVRVRGYNWIPDLPFAGEVTAERVSHRLDQAVAGGANLLRVWGGGHFATEDFLGGCDRRGLLVWHDFLFACAAYSEDPATVDDVRMEAEQAVSRMAAHPSLALWCGGNEAVWGWHDWGWREELGGRPWGGRYYVDVLPDVVARLDPGRPYLANSPWSGSLDHHPEDQNTGVVHIWTVWNEQDWSHYRDWDPRFVAEMGWCAPATHATLRAAVPDGELGPDNPGVAHHMRAFAGLPQLAAGLEPHLPAPGAGDDWLFATQLNQAWALRAGVEWLRSRPTCDGVVLWQLNDCWPAVSWATVDVGGLPKPAWYAVRRSFDARLVTVQPAQVGDLWGERGLAASLVNDGVEPWEASLVVARRGIDGTELATETHALTVPPGATVTIPLRPATATPAAPAAEVIVASTADRRSVWFFRPERELELAPPQVDVAVRQDESGTTVVDVTASTLVRDLALVPDRIAAELGIEPDAVSVDDMLITLLPGESATFRFTGLSMVDPTRLERVLASAPVMHSAGDWRGPVR